MGNMQYFLCYDTPVGFINGVVHRRVGREKIHIHSTNKAFSLGVADKMCELYGNRTHWIEDETGEIVK